MDSRALLRLLVDRLAVILYRIGNALASLLRAKGLRHAWRFFALAFLLANLKTLPFMWHVSI